MIHERPYTIGVRPFAFGPLSAVNSARVPSSLQIAGYFSHEYDVACPSRCVGEGLARIVPTLMLGADMDENMYLPQNIELVSSSTLLSMLREYQRSHVILGFSKTETGSSIREKLGDAMKVIERELGIRGYTHVALATRVN